MAKVSELKERARGLEQQGELAKAQAIYSHILKHLEGTPALMAELPLYVKIGDLALKQGHKMVAVSSYRQVAQYYARAGSSKSIRALVRKIRAADASQRAIAVDLGKDLLLYGHAAAAAEVISEYAREQSRDDVVTLLSGVAGEGSDTAARALVESGIGLLAQAPAREPRPEAAAPPAASEPAVPATAPDTGITSSMVDNLGEGQRVSGEGLDLFGLEEAGQEEPARDEEPAAEPTGGDDLQFLSIEDEAAATEAAREAAEVAAEAEEAERRASAEQAALDEALAPSEPERAAEPTEPQAEMEADEEGESEPEPEPEPQPAWEAEPEPEALELEPALSDTGAPGAGRGWEEASPEAQPDVTPEPAAREPSASHVLVGRRRRASASNRTPMYIAAGAAVVVIGAAALWFSGALSGGGGTPPAQPEGPTASTPAGATTDTGTPAADTTSAPDTAGRQDTTHFAPVGFNAVAESVRETPPPDTAHRADTARVVAPDSALTARPGTATAARPPVDTTPAVVTPPPPAVTLPTIVVPPGYATANEIVVVPGLEVLSVAEISVGGRIGHRVVQRTPEGIEVSIQAVPGDFGADTVGARGLTVTSDADTAVGTLRFWRYQIEARAVVATNTLSTLLTQLERRRPVE